MRILFKSRTIKISVISERSKNIIRIKFLQRRWRWLITAIRAIRAIWVVRIIWAIRIMNMPTEMAVKLWKLRKLRMRSRLLRFKLILIHLICVMRSLKQPKKPAIQAINSNYCRKAFCVNKAMKTSVFTTCIKRMVSA